MILRYFRAVACFLCGAFCLKHSVAHLYGAVGDGGEALVVGDGYLSQDRPPYRHGDEVDLLVWQKTDLGFKVIIDNKFSGLLYDDQVFRTLRTGDRLTGYIDHVREDGKIDVTAQPTGRRQTEAFSETLLSYLQENGGSCDLGDKSPAELIAARFGVSKKTFKKAVGDLYKRKLISIEEQAIRLN